MDARKRPEAVRWGCHVHRTPRGIPCEHCAAQGELFGRVEARRGWPNRLRCGSWQSSSTGPTPDAGTGETTWRPWRAAPSGWATHSSIRPRFTAATDRAPSGLSTPPNPACTAASGATTSTPAAPRRVLVTGSRTWTDTATIRDALTAGVGQRRRRARVRRVPPAAQTGSRAVLDPVGRSRRTPPRRLASTRTRGRLPAQRRDGRGRRDGVPRIHLIRSCSKLCSRTFCGCVPAGGSDAENVAAP